MGKDTSGRKQLRRPERNSTHEIKRNTKYHKNAGN